LVVGFFAKAITKSTLKSVNNLPGSHICSRN
jgi:hypothetical protein